MTRYDVVVVGAGPSGASAAHELAQRGRSVLLVDRAPFPRWKVCGACLSPGALSVLADMGLGDVVRELGGAPLRRLVLHARGGAAPVPLRGSVALPRATLDAALARAAVARGAVFWPASRASCLGLTDDARRLRVTRGRDDIEVSARVVVDASGLGGGLRDGPAAADEVAGGSRVGLGAVLASPEYPVAPGDLHMAVGRTGYVGLVRVAGGALTVAAALDPAALRGSEPARLASAVLTEAGLPPLPREPDAPWRGTPMLPRSNPDAGGERLFRVGDAAGYVEPFTGEGICWALSAGGAAARLADAAVERWSDTLLDEWRAYRRTTLGGSQRLCRALAAALRRPWLVRAGVAALGAVPALAEPFVAWAATPPAETGA
jgi:flavin-dependent dehydrogenase